MQRCCGLSPVPSLSPSPGYSVNLWYYCKCLPYLQYPKDDKHQSMIIPYNYLGQGSKHSKTVVLYIVIALNIPHM